MTPERRHAVATSHHSGIRDDMRIHVSCLSDSQGCQKSGDAVVEMPRLGTLWIVMEEFCVFLRLLREALWPAVSHTRK